MAAANGKENTDSLFYTCGKWHLCTGGSPAAGTGLFGWVSGSLARPQPLSDDAALLGLLPLPPWESFQLRSAIILYLWSAQTASGEV